MSKQIISNQKITRTYKISQTSEQYSSNPKLEPTKIISKQNYIRNTLESSGGQNQQRSTDNQSICTCGKWRTETYSTYNGTIQTNLKSEENCTCDENKDLSLCNCYKKNTNKISRKTQSYNSHKHSFQNKYYPHNQHRQDLLITKSHRYEEIILLEYPFYRGALLGDCYI